MDDQIDTLLVDVRAGTQGFAQDIAAMRATFDGTLVEGFSRAGGVLERGLLGAIRKGSLGFDDLKRVALGTVNDIAAQAVSGLFSGLGRGWKRGGRAAQHRDPSGLGAGFARPRHRWAGGARLGLCGG